MNEMLMNVFNNINIMGNLITESANIEIGQFLLINCRFLFAKTIIPSYPKVLHQIHISLTAFFKQNGETRKTMSKFEDVFKTTPFFKFQYVVLTTFYLATARAMIKTIIRVLKSFNWYITEYYSNLLF